MTDYDKSAFTSDQFRDICLDKDGNIWIATKKELCMYDGKTYRKFTTKDGLETPVMEHIIRDDKGVLWFNTNNFEHGVYTYENNKFIKFAPSEVENVNKLRIMALEDNPVKWFFYEDRNLYKRENNSLVLVYKKLVPARFLGQVMVGSLIKVFKDNSLYYCIGSEVCRIENDKPVALSGVKIAAAREKVVTDIIKDKTGKIWISYGCMTCILRGAGYYIVDGGKATETKLETSKEMITGMFEDSKGVIWATCVFGMDTKILNYSNNSWVTVHTDDNPFDAFSWFEDSKGNIWIGTIPKGQIFLLQK